MPEAPARMGLTARQLDTLQFIRGHVALHAVAPSYAQIAAGIGIRSKGRVTEIVRALAERGHIARLKGRARSIVLTGGTEPMLATLPAQVRRDLEAFCLTHGERIADVLADAVTLHLDALAGPVRREAAGP